jgi:hypothetical protein
MSKTITIKCTEQDLNDTFKYIVFIFKKDHS